MNPIQTDPLTAEETENLFSNGLKSTPTPNAHCGIQDEISLKGGALTPDTDQEQSVHQQKMSCRTGLFGKFRYGRLV